ncbi:siderophore-interacting protein [Microbacterium paludicola]|uniref:Siderophore-interacting protein n=1 Tax=Microbacterium paludicola TaxID=300019 RepID=A0A4Y9FT55_9MICO|nr:siderophore-interacting protein [Microbacterium paludicola]MBF0816898.1 siderophore-interacting protein [Microbacterium paludicola]TFU32418.1 siderophore-interacting protein [Microbacterium paludicola]
MTDATSTPTTFTLEREPLELRFRFCTLTAREWITPGYVRVRVEGADLVGFGSTGHDDHIRIFLPDPAAPAPTTVEEMRAQPSREFTPLYWGVDGDTGWLDLEFAVHGDEGAAGVWAASAPLGSAIGVGGPRGSMRISGTPDGWLLAGDETAIPQIRRYAALIPDGAPATILIEVADADHEVQIETSAPVEFVHRGDAPAGSALAARLEAITADDRPAGDVFGFVAAEQGIVRAGRALLVDRWGLSADRVVVKGYWKRGESEYHAPHGPGAR